MTRGGKMVALSVTDGKLQETANLFTRTADDPVELVDGSGFLVLDNKGIVRVWRVIGK